MPVMNTSQFVKLWSKDFDSVFFDEYTRTPEEGLKLLKVETMSDAYDRGGEMVGLGAMQELTEGQAYPYETYLDGPEKTIRPKEYALGLQVSRILFEDDRTGHIKTAVRELSKAAAYTREILAHDIFNSAFSTTRKGIDGSALCVNNHALIGGGTASNLGTGTLTQSNIQTAINLMEKTVNERGIPTPMRPDLLVIGPDLQWKAEELLISELQPEYDATDKVATNAVNALRTKGGLRYIVDHYLTSTTAWYLLSTKQHKLTWYWKRKTQFEQDVDFNTKHALYTASFRAVADFRFWRGIVGSTGL